MEVKHLLDKVDRTYLFRVIMYLQVLEEINTFPSAIVPYEMARNRT